MLRKQGKCLLRVYNVNTITGNFTSMPYTGWMPARVGVGVMAWLGFINLYMTRVNLSVIIVAMVSASTSSSSNSTTHRAYCHNYTSTSK